MLVVLGLLTDQKMFYFLPIRAINLTPHQPTHSKSNKMATDSPPIRVKRNHVPSFQKNGEGYVSTPPVVLSSKDTLDCLVRIPSCTRTSLYDTL